MYEIGRKNVVGVINLVVTRPNEFYLVDKKLQSNEFLRIINSPGKKGISSSQTAWLRLQWSGADGCARD